MSAGHEGIRYERSPAEQAVVMEIDAHEWNARMDSLIAQGARIITFRGAGTVNGIDPVAAEAAASILAEYVSELAEDGTTTALLFDGDEDNRAKPDIGSVFGSVADAMRDKPNVVAITAQTQGWYYPKTVGGALESATETPYETYVFPDELPGSHAALTQSATLAAYPNYEQVFVGPAGPIALEQLKDLSNKANGRAKEAGPIKITIIDTPLNASLDRELQEQLAAAADPNTHQKIAARIEQRTARPYGALFSPAGELAIIPEDYPGLSFHVFTPETF